jgi:exopolysaccharide biosynthesis protein
MKALGARDALNLDGGGSTAMVVRGRVVNRPSDPGGERRVGDGVFVGAGVR